MFNFIMQLYRWKKTLEENLPKDSFLYELLVLLPQKIALDFKRKNPTQTEVEALFASPQLFNTIEIETVNRCNGECAFCPVNRHDDKRKFKLMDETLFKNIIKQLTEIDYDGRLQIFSNNEPLLDKRICEFVKYAKEQCPKSHMSFFTNGTLLDKEKFDALIPYCDTFCIDIYYVGKCVLPDNIKEIVEICYQNPELKKKVIISTIDRNAIRNNRGGQSKNRLITYKLKTSCKLPFKQLVIRPDGKVSLCCNDPSGIYTLGDLTKNTIQEVWFSETYQQIREKLVKSGRKAIKLCEYCDNFGGFGKNAGKDYVFSPQEFFNEWKNVDNLMKE